MSNEKLLRFRFTSKLLGGLLGILAIQVSHFEAHAAFTSSNLLVHKPRGFRLLSFDRDIVVVPTKRAHAQPRKKLPTIALRERDVSSQVYSDMDTHQFSVEGTAPVKSIEFSSTNGTNQKQDGEKSQEPEEEIGFSILEQTMDNVEIVPDYRPTMNQHLSGKSGIADDPFFVKMFRGSANYIARHRATTMVLHIPAELINIHVNKKGLNEVGESNSADSKEWSHSYEHLLDDVAVLWLLGIKIVIVIGCRGLLDERLRGEGPPVVHKGIRVTDEMSLRVLKEEAGYARFEVERQLAKALKRKGGGLTGGTGGNVVSGNFVTAQPVGVRDGIDFMYTGLLRRVEVGKINQAHANNDVVILTSLGVSPSGEIFSVKSESLAAGVASSLSANKIIYLLNDPGHIRERDSGNVIMSLRLSEAKRLLANFEVHVDNSTGEYVSSNKFEPSVKYFLEKIGFSTNALLNGVKRAHLVCPSDGSLLEELFTRDDGTGTMISRDLYDGIRRAIPEDVAGIMELIRPLIESGNLVERPQAIIEKEIHTFYVYTRDGLVLACGQLKRYEGGYAEIGCLAVEKSYRKSGKGDAMLTYLERIGLKSGAGSLFVLSTQTMQWFIERGFDPVTVNDLPLSRREKYDHNRKSKIYMKNISGIRDLDAEELMWDR